MFFKRAVNLLYIVHAKIISVSVTEKKIIFVKLLYLLLNNYTTPFSIV